MGYWESLPAQTPYNAQQSILDLHSKETLRNSKVFSLHDRNGALLCEFEEEFFPESSDLDDVPF